MRRVLSDRAFDATFRLMERQARNLTPKPMPDGQAPTSAV
jgi:hypothetical protein